MFLASVAQRLQQVEQTRVQARAQGTLGPEANPKTQKDPTCPHTLVGLNPLSMLDSLVSE